MRSLTRKKASQCIPFICWPRSAFLQADQRKEDTFLYWPFCPGVYWPERNDALGLRESHFLTLCPYGFNVFTLMIILSLAMVRRNNFFSHYKADHSVLGRGPQPPGTNAYWLLIWGGAYIILMEIKCTVNIMHLNYPETITLIPVHGKIVFHKAKKFGDGWFRIYLTLFMLNMLFFLSFISYHIYK